MTGIVKDHPILREVTIGQNVTPPHHAHPHTRTTSPLSMAVAHGHQGTLQLKTDNHGHPHLKTMRMSKVSLIILEPN